MSWTVLGANYWSRHHVKLYLDTQISGIKGDNVMGHARFLTSAILVSLILELRGLVVSRQERLGFKAL